MYKPRWGRVSPRQKKIQINSALSFYGIPLQNEVAPKRERRAPNPEDSEGPVLRAVGELLAVHPQVLLAVRQNSGAMPYERDGKQIPVWFYKILREPENITLSDYWGFLVDARPFALECKRPSWRGPSSEREVKQLAFIQMFKRLGGIGGFVRSVAEAQRILEEVA